MKNRNFQTQEDPFYKKAKGISKIYHEVLLLKKFLQTKPQVKIMNIIYYDLQYTVIKTRDENEVVIDQYENNEKNFISLNDVIIQITMLEKKVEKFEIFDKSFQVILTIKMEMINNNENKKIIKK